MRERPILFSAPMVRAILEGRKTQTRRVVKPQPPAECAHYYGRQGTYSGLAVPRHYWCTAESLEQAEALDQEYLFWPSNDDTEGGDEFTGDIYGAGGMECPYGSEENCLKAADRLWVREAWAFGIHAMAAARDEDGPFVYAADGSTQGRLCDRWRPSIHMPRAASRITLEVTSVCVERLQDISEADAIAEGVERTITGDGWRRYCNDPELEACGLTPCASAANSFRSLWESINGPKSWQANPWVWVVEFKRVQP
jgi:hypothetical protein